MSNLSTNLAIIVGPIVESISHCDDESGEYGLIKVRCTERYKNRDGEWTEKSAVISARSYKEKDQQQILSTEINTNVCVTGKNRYDKSTKQHFIEVSELVIFKGTLQ